MDRKEGGRREGGWGNNVAFGVSFKNIWVSRAGRWVWRKNEWFCYCEEEASANWGLRAGTNKAAVV